MGKFAIPQSATLLREVPASELDLRSDEAIIADLTTFRPITSEKNVWAFWDKGFHAMYPSHQQTVLNWVRKLGPSWTVRLVDMTPGSPGHLGNYVPLTSEYFPPAFLAGAMDGPHAAQHTSDLLRLPLLYLHGGVWMDVGNMLHTHLDKLFWDPVSRPDTPYEMGVWVINGQIRRQWGSFGNFMLASRKGCAFVKNWHDGYKQLWRGKERTGEGGERGAGGRHGNGDDDNSNENNHDHDHDHNRCNYPVNAVGFHQHPLVQDVGLAECMADLDEFKHVVREMSDYVAQMLIGDRTRNLLDVATGWNGRAFYAEKAYKVDGVPNGVLGAVKTGFDGRKQADLFTTRLDEPDELKRRAAEDFVVDMLENTDMYKVYHNSAGTLPALGDVVKKPEFRDAVHRPGTFGELYRYGTVHWRSEREVQQAVPQPCEDELIRATPTTAQGRTDGLANSRGNGHAVNGAE